MLHTCSSLTSETTRSITTMGIPWKQGWNGGQTWASVFLRWSSDLAVVVFFTLIDDVELLALADKPDILLITSLKSSSGGTPSSRETT